MAKLRSWLKWGAIVLGGLIAVTLTGLAIASWRAGVRLERQLTAIREAGDPLGIADLAQKEIPPAENAAVILRRAATSVDAVEAELLPLATHAEDYYRDGRLNEAGQKLVADALAAYPDILPVIEQAAAAPEYAPDYDYTLSPQEFMTATMPPIQKSRAYARFLRYRGELLREQGDRDEALRNWLLLLRLDRHFEREPLMIGALISMAIRGMAVEGASKTLLDGPVGTALRDELEEELGRHPGGLSWARTLKSERAFGIDSFREIPAASIPGLMLIWSPFRQDQCNYLELLAEEIDLGPGPIYRIRRQADEIEARAKKAGMLTAMAFQSLAALRLADQRTRALVQSLRVLNALQRSRDMSGEEPAELGDLGLPVEVITDPYDGQPLKVKQTDRGWLVYAVGDNLKDDGGTLEQREDVGVGP